MTKTSINRMKNVKKYLDIDRKVLEYPKAIKTFSIKFNYAVDRRTTCSRTGTEN